MNECYAKRHYHTNYNRSNKKNSCKEKRHHHHHHAWLIPTTIHVNEYWSFHGKEGEKSIIFDIKLHPIDILCFNLKPSPFVYESWMWACRETCLHTIYNIIHYSNVRKEISKLIMICMVSGIFCLNAWMHVKICYCKWLSTFSGSFFIYILLITRILLLSK